jgi:hypothetical protein
MFWYAHNWGKVLWTYRYNLFEHIGKESTVENHVEFSINPKCFDSNAHYFNFYGEKFDTQNCEHFMVSPCREPKIQKELELVGRDNIESKPFLRMNERKMLMAKLNVTIIEEKITDKAISCDDVCLKNNRKCSEDLYPFVNNCEEMKTRHPCHEPCFSELYRGFHTKAPLFGQRDCVFLDQPSYKCSDTFDWKDFTKLCACKGE